MVIEKKPWKFKHNATVCLVIINIYSCPKDGFDGLNMDPITGKECEIDADTGLYPTTCRYKPTGAKDTSTSLLNAEYLDSVS